MVAQCAVSLLVCWMLALAPTAAVRQDTRAELLGRPALTHVEAMDGHKDVVADLVIGLPGDHYQPSLLDATAGSAGGLGGGRCDYCGFAQMTNAKVCEVDYCKPCPMCK
mmetsp:Transcript_31522/g.73102  ORF Transcript_31522/g.73102 Transcript_31522/m.73102 type:complete len:109 (+) Transcript_31522:79-405(+)